MRPQAMRAPTVLETIRMDLTVCERAVAAGDSITAKRCVDAAERMFAGLRDVFAAGGVDVGPPVWESAVEPDDRPTPVVPAAVFITPELPPPARVPLFESPELTAVIVAIGRRDWTWRILARLTWLWLCCFATLVWRAVRRGLTPSGGSRKR